MSAGYDNLLYDAGAALSNRLKTAEICRVVLIDAAFEKLNKLKEND